MSTELAGDGLSAAPVAGSDRVESLDVLRGFALLGILLLNILGFGLHSAGYFNPLIGVGEHLTLNLTVWAGVNIMAEGAMRALFSMLFGAGVVMFTTGIGTTSPGKGAILHYRRNFWLLALGAFDAYVLLWTGDILMVYAIAGALLYPLRNTSPRRLITAAVLLMLVTSAFYGASGVGLAQARDAALEVAAAPAVTHDPNVVAGAEFWRAFSADFLPDAEAYAQELQERRSGYLEVAVFTADYMVGVLLLVVPVYLLWDALAMMLLGMAFYKLGLLSAGRSSRFYLRLAAGGFAVGLVTNSFEVWRGFQTGFDLLSVFSYVLPTYHVGRLGMALGYLGLIMLVCRRGVLPGLRARLGAVGRMALTNYLMHSLICLFLFTGAGLALVGELERWALYPIVLLIWLAQLAISPWWLARFRYGPAEWLWRSLTYGARQRFFAVR